MPVRPIISPSPAMTCTSNSKSYMKSKIRFWLPAIVLMAGCSNGVLNVIPQPLEANVSTSVCNPESFTAVCPADADAGYAAALLCKAFPGLEAVESASGKGVITIATGADGEPESYTLKTTRKSASIVAADKAGAIWAAQTLIQEARNGGILVGTIKDQPRYSWRGYMLDESRHFMGEDYVMEVIDRLSNLKMNIFHWHLTDAPGWRIEIDKYPKLIEIGSIGCHSDPTAPSRYYTKEQIRRIVAHADSLGVTIVPEVDMPGHGTSSNRSYPEYSGGGNNFTFNPGIEGVYSYLTDIIREVDELFPGKYFHIGGDEVSHGNKSWNTDPNICALMKREGFTDIHDAEAYFVNRMADSVKVLGRTMMGWDDMLACNPDPENTVFTWWRHDKPDHVRDAFSRGHKVVLCPRLPCYFDFIQDSTHVCGRVWPGGKFCPLDHMYAFPDCDMEGWELAPGTEAGILGIQANLWTELVHTPERAEFMTFPRIEALSEACWTAAELKDWDSFCRRLEYEYAFLDTLGINYFDHRDPAHHAEPLGPFSK